MEGFDVETILSIISLLLGGGLFLWVKVVTRRAFTGVDKQIDSVQDAVAAIEVRIERLYSDDVVTGKSIVQIQEALKGLSEIKDSIKELVAFKSEVQDRYQKKSDFVRESQIIANQIEALHKKLEYLDSKMDRKGSA